MLLGTLTADECAKCDVAVAAAIVLAVDAESVELLLSDPLAQIGGHFRTLNITVHSRLPGRLFRLLRSSWSAACSLIVRRIIIGGNFHRVGLDYFWTI